ncbi:MAG: TIGR02710 family CRISPR-associated CARF protein [Acidobacteriota bacterium]
MIFSIRQAAPAAVIFFVSPESRSMVAEKILPALLQDPGRLPDHEFVVTPDGQDLGDSVLTLLREVPRALRKLGAGARPWPDVVDYTAGTKVMSAAVVLASSRFPCKVAYVGTPDPSGRSKGGLGIVLDGRERVYRQENPWNRLAWYEVHAAAELFNRGQYGNAAEMLRRILDQLDDPEVRELYQVLADVFAGFAAWDVFDHGQARVLLGQRRETLQHLALRHRGLFPGLEAFAAEVAELFPVLVDIKPQALTWQAVLDLLSNARRRAELEGKYEDAVARCYAAIEKAAQRALLQNYGIDSGKVDPEKVPEALRPRMEARKRIRRNRKGFREEIISIGLRDQYELLAALGDPLGKRFQAAADKISRHLDARNRSILAHGFTPARREDYERLFADACELLEVPGEDLTRFPILDLEGTGNWAVLAGNGASPAPDRPAAAELETTREDE